MRKKSGIILPLCYKNKFLDLCSTFKYADQTLIFFFHCRPKNKYIRITKDEHFRVDEHYLSNVGIQAEKCCAYDLEDVDVVWLNILNGERALLGT